MKIRELHITHFGKFEEQKVLFHSGVNIIYGHNESGKSTIHAFIRAMLFGLDKTRGRSRIGEFELRQPWTNPSWFAGSMKVEHAGKIYRIERDFAEGAKSLRLINETDACEVEDAQEGMRRLLCGVSETAFCNTVFIRQANAATESALGDEIRRCLLNIQETGDAGLDIQTALSTLQMQKKELESRKKRELGRLSEQIEEKKYEYEAARKELDQLHLIREDLEQAPAAVTDQDVLALDMAKEEDLVIDKGSFLPENNHRTRTLLIVLAMLACVAAILSAGCAILTSGMVFRILMWILAAGFLSVAGGCFYLYFSFRPVPDDEEDDTELSEDEKIQKEHLLELEKEEKRQYEEKMHIRRAILLEREKKDLRRMVLEEEKERKRLRVEELKKELDEMSHRYDQVSAADKQIQAIELAMQRIREITQQLCGEFGNELTQQVGRILSELTDGRFSSISTDERMNVQVNTPQKLLSIDQVSFASMNQIYFALRMAAGDLLDGENLPLVLDDTFTMYDDDRLCSVLTWLKDSPRQVILFTSQRREKNILDQL